MVHDMSTAWKDCCCCGGIIDVQLRQWWNQDDEYSCCQSCIEWMIDDQRETVESINQLYGKPGVHRPVTKHDKQEASSCVLERATTSTEST